ncbi:beta strand repeat-containing protein, partial [Paraburkholderia fungorum]|uniref:beta strand repeat-containing protein n=1 Tax=Paraburkholderia fungorum TaxID=134537 RepID=UPI000DB29791
MIAASVTAPCASAQVVIPPSSSTIQLQTLSPGASRFDAPSGTVVNAASGDGVSGSNAQNWTLSNEGSISGAANGVNLSSAAANGARVDNYGSVQGGANSGIAMSNGGTVYNHAGASVSGAQNGVYMAVNGGTVSNDGTITANAASGTAVNFISGGSFTQGASGLISGFTGIASNGGSFVGTNAGTVAVTGVALSIGGGSLEGTFTNHVGATLQTSGNVNAVEFAGNTFGTLVNNGTITSHATGSSAGVWVGSNASAEIDNAGGTIAGPIGLLITGVGSVVNNSGTLTGTGGTAISVTGSGNLITLDTGSVLNGDLVVAAGTAGNKLSLKGTGNEDSSLVGLAGLTMAGTNWLLSGNVSTTGTTAAATTVRSGTLTITGALSNNGVGGGTTINAGGTLQIGNGGTTGSVSGNIVDNGALIFNRADAVNIGTVISGSGAVAQAGSGTLTLTSANSYTGGTYFNAGTTKVTSDANLGGVSGALVFNGGALQAAASLASARAVTLNSVGSIDTQAYTVTLSGPIGGAGALIKQGLGTLLLTGQNSFTGTTTVAAGTLQIGDGGTSGTLTGDVVNDGALVFNRADTLGYSGAISGSGSLLQAGAGTLVLTGDVAHTGGTTIDGGTLQIGNGGTRGSLAGNVVNDGTLVFDRSVSGSGAVAQSGTGTLILNSVQTYTGNTNVTAGALVIGDASHSDAQLAGAGAISVAEGAALGGYGKVNGSVLNMGMIGVGNTLPALAGGPDATFTIAGDLDNHGTLTLANGVTGDRLVVGGTYTSNGGKLLLDSVLDKGGATSQSDMLVANAVSVGTGGATHVSVQHVGGVGAY